MIIKKIGAKSLAKVLGTIYAILGGILGIFFAIGAPFSSELPGPAWMFGVGAVVILPIVYGIMGFVMGWLIALVYNFVAKKIGGIQIDME